MLALPAAAACFTGQPVAVRYDDGTTLRILKRRGDEMTVSETSAEGEKVQKWHLMLFLRETREADGRKTRETWSGRLPGMADLVPGFRFAVDGTSPAAKGGRNPTRLEGEVTGVEEVALGDCRYAAVVIDQDYYLQDGWLFSLKTWLSPDMGVILRKQFQASGIAPMTQQAMALE